MDEDREGERGGGGGPRKMVFSTLALARGKMTRRRRVGRRKATECIVLLLEVIELSC